ncbi:helix-turn-helix domain-containing protein [Echinicola salinicaeni]|uniref:helix-turn-helix domain-containing protein n=1 Tax=Echinicola salinicaeni TaxID=2762757 RepID=UPI00164972FA|nr:AraC family transcriptional regulator [Echinicola salinicaeni]
MVMIIIAGIITDSNMIYQFPLAAKISNILCFLFIPLSYLYIRKLLYSFSFSRKDFVHIIPFLLVLIDSIPYLISTHEEKINLLNMGESGLQSDSLFLQLSFIPVESVNIMYHIFFGIYFILQLELIIRFISNQEKEFKERNQLILNWVFFFISIQFFLFYPYFIYSYSPFQNEIYEDFSQGAGALVILSTCIYLFRQPKILYGFAYVMNPSSRKEKSKKRNKGMTNGNSYTSKFLSESRILEIDLKLNDHIENNAPYLNQGYNLNDMSEELDIPLYILSSFINKQKGVNFNDFLNKYRIEHCKQKIRAGEWKNITLEGLAFDCGFSNRNSFRAAFKKFSGQTPSEFIKNFK